MFNYEPTDEREFEEIPNSETLKAMKEADEIAAAWRERQLGIRS